jgi:hypothetical protein
MKQAGSWLGAVETSGKLWPLVIAIHNQIELDEISAKRRPCSLPKVVL